MSGEIKLLIYTLISIVVIIIGLILCRKFIKERENKFTVLKIAALSTVAFHYSCLWVDFFSTGKAEVTSTMLLPIYPCNIIMWLLVVCAFCKKRENKILNYIVEFSAIGGTVCGFIGIAFNEIFLSTPDFLDYDSLKGLLSHTTMLFGTLYLFDAYNIKIKVINNTISTFIGLMIFTIVGGIVNLLYFIFNLGECNAMFMTTPPFEDIPIINFYTIGITGLLLVFVLTNIYEFITLKKEDRWYNQLRRSK